MRGKNWLRGCAFALAAMVGVAAPSVAADKTLKAVVHADLKVVDPTWTSIYITQRFAYVIYDTLFALNSKFEPKPQMVDSYTVSGDKMVFTFTLRPGLSFHDGSPLTATDVVASMNRWMTKVSAGQVLKNYTGSLEVIDPKTFRLTLKAPFGLTLEALGNAATAFIMPEKIANTPVTEQITATIGSGPFIMDRSQWRPGDKVVFKRNPAYVPRAEPPDYLSGGKIPKLDRLEWLYIPDANTTLSALLAGEIDYFEAPPLDFIGLLKDNPDITVMIIDKLGTQGLIRPNSLNPPFNNYKARQALLYIADQKEYMEAVVGDMTQAMEFCGAYFMCSSANETAVGSVRKADPAKAKALLAEGGYKGEKIVILQPTDRPQYNAATMVMAEGLRRAGANVELQAADWSTIAIRRARKDPVDKGGWNLVITTQGGPDVTSPISNVWFNSRCDRANNGWACDDTLEKLVGDYAAEYDPAKRRQMIEGIQARAYESLPYVPFGQFFQPIAFRKNVTGVVATTVPVYWNIDKK